jgi:hypothetical protein
MNHSAVTVANTATLVVAANQAKAGFLIANVGSATVYLGGSGVTTANGYPLDPGEYEGNLYGIVASGTNAVRVLEWGENEI